MKQKILIVGAFPIGKPKVVYGGQLSVCMRLIESTFTTLHEVRTIDTTQISNPPPAFPLRALLAVRRLYKFIIELLFHRPDSVLLFLARGASVYEKGLMARIAQLLGIPALVFPRAGGIIDDFDKSPFHAGFVRETLGKADVFLCQGKTFQKFALDALGFDEAHAPIIPNWTASDNHLQIGNSRLYKSGKPTVRLLFLGWLEAFKGVNQLLDSSLKLKQSGMPFHLTIAGDGTAMAEANTFIAEHGLESYVTFAGWVDDAKRTALLRESDIFVLPSWSEGLPNAMIEAMSAGLACVVTDVGMIPDYLVDGRDALIVPARDTDALTDALSLLIKDGTRRTKIAQNGYAIASKQFSLENGVRLISEAINLATKRV